MSAGGRQPGEDGNKKKSNESIINGFHQWKLSAGNFSSSYSQCEKVLVGHPVGEYLGTSNNFMSST